MILGAGIPFVLGFVHLLYGWACWVGLAAAAALLLGRRAPEASAGPPSSGGLASAISRYAGTALPLLAVAGVAWPPLVRPLLDGDTLGYHLPNAALWVHDGSLWSNLGGAWWYPGGSELLAAGILATSGVLAAGWSGAIVLLLLGLRLSEWGRREGLPAWIAGAGSAAVVGCFALAKQAGNLENDVFLAALFLETLWAGRFDRAALTRSAALCGLVKPTGWLYAATALISRRASFWTLSIAAAPLLLWAARDAVLWGSALHAPIAMSAGELFGTTIAGNGWDGLATLARALIADGGATAALFGLGIAAIVWSPDRGLRLAAAAALAIVWVHPFGFRDTNPQLANGWALRYAAPLLAVGAAFGMGLLARLPRPARAAAGALASATAALEVGRIAGIFANDATTHGTLWVLGAAALALALPRPRVRAVATSALGLALVAYATVLAGSHPLDYYDEWLRPAPNPSRLFDWLAARRAPALVAWAFAPVRSTPRARPASSSRAQATAVPRRGASAGSWSSPPTTRSHRAISPCSATR